MQIRQPDTPYSIIVSLYTTVIICSLVLTNKIIPVGNIPFSACLVVFPLRYVFGDIIAEIYGYQAAAKLIWITLGCALIFSLVVSLVILAPSESYYNNANAYKSVFSMDIRFVMVGSVAIGVGGFVNAYLISKWKVLMKGRLYWLRSLGSSSIAELANTLIAIPLAYVGVIPFERITTLLVWSYLFKILYVFIVVWPSAIIIRLIKKSTNIDVFDYQVSYNPFKY